MDGRHKIINDNVGITRLYQEEKISIDGNPDEDTDSRDSSFDLNNSDSDGYDSDREDSEGSDPHNDDDSTRSWISA